MCAVSEKINRVHVAGVPLQQAPGCVPRSDIPWRIVCSRSGDNARLVGRHADRIDVICMALGDTMQTPEIESHTRTLCPAMQRRHVFPTVNWIGRHIILCPQRTEDAGTDLASPREWFCHLIQR